jgi:hypothetical protein
MLVLRSGRLSLLLLRLTLYDRGRSRRCECLSTILLHLLLLLLLHQRGSPLLFVERLLLMHDIRLPRYYKAR